METSCNVFLACHMTEALAKKPKVHPAILLYSATLSPLDHCSSPLVKSLRQSSLGKRLNLFLTADVAAVSKYSTESAD